MLHRLEGSISRKNDAFKFSITEHPGGLLRIACLENTQQWETRGTRAFDQWKVVGHSPIRGTSRDADRKEPRLIFRRYAWRTFSDTMN